MDQGVHARACCLSVRRRTDGTEESPEDESRTNATEWI